MSYPGYLNHDLTLPCGCVINIDADYDAPRCRCGGGCWDDEGEWEVTHEITPCDTHKEKS